MGTLKELIHTKYIAKTPSGNAFSKNQDVTRAMTYKVDIPFDEVLLGRQCKNGVKTYYSFR